MAWSGGKNAAFALDRLRSATGAGVEGLWVWLDRSDHVLGNRVSLALIEAQGRSVGLPLRTVSFDASRAGGWDEALADDLKRLHEEGVERLVFGDAQGSSTFERHARLATGLGLEACFPLMDDAPSEVAQAIVASKLRSVLTAVDRSQAPRAWVGRTYSAPLIDEHPEGVHPTGGRGEYHTFACGGPVLQRPVSPQWVDLVETDGWAVAQLAPGAPRGYGASGLEP